MAHLIEDSERFFEIGDEAGNRLAWHTCGTRVPRAEQATTTVREAFKRGGLLYDVEKRPLMYPDQRGRVVTATDKFVLVRPAHWFNGVKHPEKLLSTAIVGAGYTPIRNVDIADALEPIRASWPIETCGVLREGKIVFAAFDAGEFAVKKTDHHRMFFVAQEVKDGSGSMSIFVTPVRTVCNNTLQLGIGAAEWSANIRHDAGAYRDLGFWSRVAPQLAEKSTRVQEAIEALASAKATDADVLAIAYATFPDARAGHKARATDLVPLSLTASDAQAVADEQRATEARNAAAQGTRSLVLERYALVNERSPEIAGTLYAAANAANEVAMWLPGRGKAGYETQLHGWRADASRAAFRTATKILRGEELKPFSAN